MKRAFDVAVIGGGIVGLAHAWMAARRGLRVLLLERTAVAEGASVRNFGMIWPIGQPGGELREIALRSREFWLELRDAGVVDADECGSIHLAHHVDELAVLEEFQSAGTHAAEMLTPAQVLELSELANPDGLQGGLLSRTELRVDPRTASARLAAWLQEQHGVEAHFQTPVARIEGSIVHAADGRTWSAERIFVCSGSDLQTLYGEILRESGLQLCKLQMLKAVPQPLTGQPSPHLASGLTLRHYTSFAGCPSLPGLRERIAQETPELDQYGIHVMAAQFPNGEVLLGDSHEYGADVTPFDKTEIDDLILRELRKVIRLPDWTISERWHGVYAKHPQSPVFETTAPDGVHVFVGTGGGGMTMSFGLADRAWNKLSN